MENHSKNEIKKLIAPTPIQKTSLERRSSAVLIEPAVEIGPALLISAGSIVKSMLNFHIQLNFNIPDIKKCDTFLFNF